MADGGEPQPNKDEFIEVENRKRKHNRRFNKNNSGFIIGRANSDETLKIVDKLRYLFVSRVGENVDSDSLKQYLKKKAEGEKPFVCDRLGCTKSFVSKAKLTEHLQRHNGEKRHKCPVCGKQYANKPDLRIHLRSVCH
ncbi:zinc finger protein 431-like [Homalodisca vitripennis]|uniref:zinc finger protein 431-like n=1 Tax=Homalodisca vitripennis TaxID=197043 RepID=UPI001EEB81D3|nr:zinc finger protein 431-like [Homalodisca vitripennis]